MTTVAAACLAVAAAAAVTDWLAVARDNRRLEYAAKPLTTLALIATAVTLEPVYAERRGWFVAAVALSLAGDVFLMLPADRFIAGLVSFLAAHVAYIAGLATQPWRGAWLAAAVVVVVVAILVAGRPVLRALRRRHGELLAPAGVYLVVLCTMVIVAGATGPWLAFAGAVVFLSSDSVLAWNRFVRRERWAPVTIMVTYHVAQAGLILSLVVQA